MTSLTGGFLKDGNGGTSLCFGIPVLVNFFTHLASPLLCGSSASMYHLESDSQSPSKRAARRLRLDFFRTTRQKPSHPNTAGRHRWSRSLSGPYPRCSAFCPFFCQKNAILICD